jgi:hypothetical protein
MDDSIKDNNGRCPRCDAAEIEREVFLQTSMRVVSGVLFFCQVCGLQRRALSSDREEWFNVHKQWQSSAVPEETWDEFDARWPKKVERPTYGRAEPIGNILPRQKDGGA